MSSDFACLSLLELEELCLDHSSERAHPHLDDCLRCQALLGEMRATYGREPLEISELLPSTNLREGGITRHALPAGARVGTGALWRAASGPEADFSWVVAIIARSPDGSDALLVAPIATDTELATDTDLLLDARVLGYPAFLDMTNIGSLLRGQLFEPVAELERSAAEAMVGIYSHLLGGTPPPEDGRRGIPVVGEADPRLLAQAARAEALQELWRPAHEVVRDIFEEHADALADPLASGTQDRDPAVPSLAPSIAHAPVPALSGILLEHLAGPRAPWDRPSLLEETGADGARLDALLDDRLDLTDKRDIPDLARILHILDVDWDRAEPAVRRSLERSPGGTRRAEGPSHRTAARSRAGADADQTTNDLYADSSTVDTSATAREREVAAYIAELQREIDQLD
jgi:hypothetical protein